VVWAVAVWSWTGADLSRLEAGETLDEALDDACDMCMSQLVVAGPVWPPLCRVPLLLGRCSQALAAVQQEVQYSTLRGGHSCGVGYR
jgi:hypothetical protein